ncbi:Alpha/Beta hydrolase protein [Tuber indicum]|nr:Alpha/Beta hydrolase protein [Tuber indicum]
MHGLFGSKQNNHSISKALARDLNRPVYTLDLRNHGESPHTPQHNYEAMAGDVEHFLKENKLGPKTVLIGHSMGAKTAMTIALRKPSIISSIIAVDNAPIEAALHSSFGGYVRAMRKIEDSHLAEAKAADAILAEVEPDIAIRQFLLRNLVRGDCGRLSFRIPVRTLARELDNMATFAYHPDEVRFEKRALFVRGTRSPYIPDEVIPVIGRFFPLFRLKDIDAGHWVISEKPNEFKEAVIEFLNEEE